MANITFTGVYGSPVRAGYMAGWFRKVSPASHDSGWSGVRVIGADGYYNINLGDADWLDVDGIASAGDQVLLAFWEGNIDRTALDLTAASWIVVTLTSDVVYTRNIINIPANEPWNNSSGIQSPNGLDIPRLTNWNFNNRYAKWVQRTSLGYELCNQSQYYEAAAVLAKYVEVFPCFAIAETTIIWEDPADAQVFDRGVYGLPPYGIVHQWNQLGGLTFTVRHRGTTEQGQNSGDGTFNIRTLWRAPSAGFEWVPQPLYTSSLVTFNSLIVDPDNRVSTVRYYVNGVLVATVGRDDSWQYQFTDNVQYTIRQEYTWNNGWANATVQFNRTLTVSNTLPVPSFSGGIQDANAKRYTWTDTSSDVDGSIIARAWTLFRNVLGTYTVVAQAAGASFSYSISETGDYRIRLTVTDDSGGQASVQEDFNVVVSPPGAIGVGKGSQFMRPVGSKGMLE